MRILIVDDSLATVNIIQRCLKQLNRDDLETRKASGGLEALDIARHWEPDLIISDWHMPDMTGLELLHAINREMLDFKLGLVTTETAPDKLAEAKDAGARFIVNKPFRNEQLLNAINPILEQSRDISHYTDRSDEADPALETATENNARFAVALADIEVIESSIQQSVLANVKLEQSGIIDAELIQPPFVLAFFCSNQDQRVRSICLMDHQAACLLGAAVTNTSPALLKTYVEERKLPQSFVSGCETILHTLSDTFLNAQDQSPVSLTLQRTNLVNKPFPKLKSLMITAAEDRRDICVSMGRFEPGKIILVAS